MDRWRLAAAVATVASLALPACGGSSTVQTSGGSGGGPGSGATGGNTGGTTVPGTGATPPTVGGTATGATSATGATGVGTGGSAPADSVVGTLGQPCSPPGALACAGNAQKLTILCGGDGTWQPNLTCGASEFCDSRPGTTAGTCLVADPACADQSPGAQVCDGDRLLQCGPDLVRSTVLEECSVETCGAMCPVPCPTGSFINCDPECGEVDPMCRFACMLPFEPANIIDLSTLTQDTVLRLPPENELCRCDETRSVFANLKLPASSSVTVEPPWGLFAHDYIELCSSQLEQCASLPAGVPGERMVLAPVGAFGTNLRILLSQPTCL